MTHTVYKAFTVGAFEKEEKWLNEMSAKGLQLTDVGFCRYVFKEGTPGEYVYRLELLENLPSNPQSAAYIRFMNEVGVEQVGSIFRWVYFRKKAMDAPFDLYSDVNSKIKHFKRINVLCNWLSGINLATGIINLFYFTASLKYFKMGINNTVRYSNLSICIINILIATVIFLIARPIRKRLKELRKEQSIRE